MVFTEQDLNIGINPFDILNEATYVDGDALISPFTVSMVENSDIGGVVVRFSDVESISESYGCDYIDAMIAIAEENNVDPNYMAVVVDEADIIADPYIITELANVVVNPQSPYSLAYQFCEACLDCFLESGGDEDYLDIMINESNRVKQNFNGLSPESQKRIMDAQDDPRTRFTPGDGKYHGKYMHNIKGEAEGWKNFIRDAAANRRGRVAAEKRASEANERYIASHRAAQKLRQNIKGYQTSANQIGSALASEMNKNSEYQTSANKIGSALASEMNKNSEYQKHANQIGSALASEMNKNSEYQKHANQIGFALASETKKSSDYKDIIDKMAAEGAEQQKKLDAVSHTLAQNSKKLQATKKELKKSKRNTVLAGLGGLAAGAAAKYAYDNRGTLKDKASGLIGKVSGRFGGAEQNIKTQMSTILQKAQGKPKSWIGQKIAALRNMYSQWLNRANAERDAGRASMFKRIAATIMNCIDTLMEKLQDFAG